MSDPQDPFQPLPEAQAQAQAQPLPQPTFQQPPQPPFVAPPPFSHFGQNQFGQLRPDDGSEARAQGVRMMLIGALFAVVGIVITATTYSAASHGGGTYMIMYGPIIFGPIRFIQGLIKYSSAPRGY